MTEINDSKNNSSKEIDDESILEETSTATGSDATFEPIISDEDLDPDKQDWQNSMKPWMIRIVVGLAIFFFIASLLQIIYLHQKISQAPELDSKTHLLIMDSSNKSTNHLTASFNENQRFMAAVMAVLSTLETNAVKLRYHQANVSLMSRVWTRYLGFVTGMVLALVGAIFILGKLRENESEANVDTAAFKMKFSTASPGLILAGLGTLLMVTTIVTHNEIKVDDSPLYTQGIQMTSTPLQAPVKPHQLIQQEPETAQGVDSQENGVEAPPVLNTIQNNVKQQSDKTSAE